MQSLIRKSIYFLVAVSGVSAFAFADESFSDPSTGETFPKTITFTADGKEFNLDATGVATRKKLIIKVYSVAHYLQHGIDAKGEALFNAIFSDQNAKQLTLKWVRDVPSDKMREAFNDAFKKVFKGDVEIKLKPQIDKLLSFFSFDGKKGDELIFRWIPGGNIVVLLNQKELGRVQNEEFAKGMWSIWLGPDSIVNRQELVSFVK